MNSKKICQKIATFDLQRIASKYKIKFESNRINSFKGIIENSKDLNQILKELNVDYKIILPAEYSNLHHLNQIDLFYSESVLQRINVKFLDNLMLSLFQKMNYKSIFFHRTDQCDVNAQEHIVKIKNRLSYLRFNTFFFSLINSPKLNNQNRLREFEYIDLFKRNNFQIIYLFNRYSKKDLDYVKNSKIQNKYYNFLLKI